MKFEIRNRRSGKVQFECELGIELETQRYGFQLGAAIKVAVLRDAVLRDAVLRDADLTGAVLTRAVLTGADLTGAVLTRAVLTGADLTGADLRDADLRDAVLRDADLRDADLTGAVLTRAVLTRAVLTRAVLTRAVLTRAVLTRADLMPIRVDLFDVLLRATREVDGLAQALKEGKVNGSCYVGECACLVGTIANIRHCAYFEVPNIEPNSDRPSERWFLGIKKGDTPENSAIVKITIGWIEEFQKLAAILPNVAGAS